MHAKPDLRVVLKWTITGSGSVIAAVITLDLMTAQIADSLTYADCEFTLVERNGDELFSPSEIGLTPVMSSTANYRGFYCQYSILNNRFCLTKFWVGFDSKNDLFAKCGKGPRCFGQLPSRDTHHGVDALTDEPVECFGDWYYENFQHEIAYSGGILVGHDFIRETYVHGGFPRAYQFLTLHELVFDNGELTSTHDYTPAAHEFRQRLTKLHAAPVDDVQCWLQNTFSRDYRRNRRNA